MSANWRKFILIFFGVILPLVLLLAEIFHFGGNAAHILGLFLWLGTGIFIIYPFME